RGCTVTHFVDLAAGDLLGSTGLMCATSQVIAGPERFLIGQAGYSMDSLIEYGRDGPTGREWGVHASVVCDEDEVIRAFVPSDDREDTRTFSVLSSNGEILPGPLALASPRSPILVKGGWLVLVREGNQLVAVDRELVTHPLWSAGPDAEC